MSNRKIIEQLGGLENIETFKLLKEALFIEVSDETKMKLSESQNDVIMFNRTIIFKGQKADEIFAELEQALKKETIEKNNESGLNKVFLFIASLFGPIIPALAGSGILRGILLIALQFGLLNESSTTYLILNAASNVVFYFLPIFLAFTTSNKLGINPISGALIAGALLHPNLIKLGDIGDVIELFNVPVIMLSYSSTIIPIILAILLYYVIYKGLEKYLPDSLKDIVIPLAALLIVFPITLYVIGPLGYHTGQFLANMISFLIEKSGLLTGLIVGGIWAFCIALGLNWAINPIMINNISTFGYDFIRPFTFASNFSVLGIAIGVFLKTKNKRMKNFALSNIITLGISGISEPMLYGVIVKNSKYIICQLIGGAIGSAYIGLMKVTANSFIFGSFLTLPALVGEKPDNFTHAMVGLTLSLVTGAVLAYFVTDRQEALVE